MKRFVKDIIYGVLFFCLVWGLMEWAMAVAPCVNEYAYKYHYIQHNDSIKTLLIGNSYFENSINPHYLGDSVFDFANSGRWIYFDVQLMPRIVDEMPNLKTVIFPMGYDRPYHSLHYDSLRDIDKDYIYYYEKSMHILYDRFPENIWYSSALVTNKFGLQYWSFYPKDKLGYSSLDGQRDNWHNEQIFEPKYLQSDKADLCYKEYRMYLMQLAQICAQKKLRFVVVTCPCADCYLAKTTDKGLRRLYDLVDSVAAYYPIEYYNYLDDQQFRADSIYYNASHLNTIGADMFAKRLKDDLGL